MTIWETGTPAILRKTQEIARDVLAPQADRIDRDAVWPASGLAALLSEGFGGLVVPRQYGGKGHGLQTLARVCEILGKDCASTSICYGMHCVGASVIAVNATKAQQDHFLAPICEGDHITTLSLSETGTGVHFYLPQTRLDTEPPDHYLLSGCR